MILATGSLSARPSLGAAPGLVAASQGPLLVAGIGEAVFSNDRATTLVAYGLGSCVGLSAWDPRTRVGGLAHFMLPSGPTDQARPESPVKFIQGGLEYFLDELRRRGVMPSRAELKAAGGASMLQIGAGGLQIGRRNTDTILAALAAAGLKLAAQDLGGTAGRTVQLEVGTGRLLVKSVSTLSQL